MHVLMVSQRTLSKSFSQGNLAKSLVCIMCTTAQSRSHGYKTGLALCKGDRSRFFSSFIHQARPLKSQPPPSPSVPSHSSAQKSVERSSRPRSRQPPSHATALYPPTNTQGAQTMATHHKKLIDGGKGVLIWALIR